jgi:hypothetical protein
MVYTIFFSNIASLMNCDLIGHCLDPGFHLDVVLVVVDILHNLTWGTCMGAIAVL